MFVRARRGSFDGIYPEKRFLDQPGDGEVLFLDVT